jgi:hypothetical protein
VKYVAKPWYFKAGRLNMMSGEVWGVYLNTPWFTWRACRYGIGFI